MSEIKKLSTATEQAIQNMPRAVYQAMKDALFIFASTSTSKFMIQTGTGSESNHPGNKVPVDATRLTWRTANLARSLIRGDHPQHIQEIKVDGMQFIGKLGTSVPYARIHEKGGEIHISSRSEIFRRNRVDDDYFDKLLNRNKDVSKLRFGQFRKGTTAGRGMTVNAFDIKIKARPFLQPAVTDAETVKGVQDAFGRDTYAEIREAMRSALTMVNK